jgi:hypothetical protein
MYSGSMGAGAKMPYGIAGWDVSPGYGGRYLGNIFDDIRSIAGKVGLVSGELADVASGQKTVATVPTGYASLTLPIPGSPVSQSIPLWVLGAGAAGLLYLAFRPRRR